jgi:N-acyl-D-aspartate/D-glutamate deacylase
MARLNVGQPSMHFDLPVGGRRLLQPALGYAATIVSGRIVYLEGEETGALPGKIVRYSPEKFRDCTGNQG